MEKLTKLFVSSLKRGAILSFRELSALAKEKNLKVKLRDVRNMRSRVLATTVFKSVRLKPRAYMSVAIHKLGLLQADAGFFEKRIAPDNDDYIGFFLAVCVSTGLLMPVLIKNNTTEIYQEAITQMVNSGLFPAIHTIQTDKEKALVSRRLQRYVMENFGIRMYQLVGGTKAFAVERAIRTLKTKISQVQTQNKTDVWTDIIFNVANHHNEQKAFNTSFRRCDIDDSNYLQYLGERYGEGKKDDITLGYAGSELSYSFFKRFGTASKVFKFAVGEKVFVTVLKDKSVNRETKTFLKKSRQGVFYPRVYRIFDAKLRSTHTGAYVPGKKKQYKSTLLAA